MEPAIIPQVVAGALIALFIYHGVMFGVRRFFASETTSAMRWLAMSGFFALTGIFVVWAAAP